MQVQLANLSLAQMLFVHNSLASGVDGAKEVKTLPSKAKGIEKIEALLGDAPAIFEVDEESGEVHIEFPSVDEVGENEGGEEFQNPAPEGEGEDQPEGGDQPEDEDGDQPDESQGDESQGEVESPVFVKATKEELAAMDAVTRADYRKRRRAAARAARKAKSGA